LDPAFTSFILGYHGCDHRVAERVLAGKEPLRESHNDYDWLGDGIYFWEHNARRAFDFAVELSRKPHPSGQKIKRPAVIGAVIDLGLCLNLLDSRFIDLLTAAYAELNLSSELAGVEMPANTGGIDLLRRNLDCAVLRTLHNMREDNGEAAFETVRAVFVEGDPLYPLAGFAAKSHIQICVRDLRCIKGYFRPLAEDGRPMRFGKAGGPKD
jgi:hypothetical protein